ncbi:MAG: hypothetical protein ACRC0X_03715, partial [Brevinema sp.]
MSKYFYIFFLTVLVIPNTLLFAQSFIQEPNMENKTDHRNRDNRRDRDQHERTDRDSKNNSKTSFSFWFSTPKQDRSHMKVFDTHAIFDFDKEIFIALTNTKELQYEFRKEIRLLDLQIRYLKNELIILIQDHQRGTNKSQQMVETYTQLYQLCDKRYSVLDDHTKAMQDILSATYQKYHNKIQEKLSVANKDPDIIV